jgi:copper chaperone CopZ
MMKAFSYPYNLQGRKSVKKVDIDYMTDSIVMEIDSSLINKEEIKKRLEKSNHKDLSYKKRYNKDVSENTTE